MTGSRLYLRKTHASLSAGTLLCRRGEQDDPLVWHVSAWSTGTAGKVFDVAREDTVERRPRGGPVRPPRISPPVKRRRVAIVKATARAVQQARLLVPERVIENLVAEALVECPVRDPGEEGEAIVRLDDRAVAVVTRSRSPLSGRKQWLIVSVREAA